MAAVEYNSQNDVFTGQMFIYVNDSPLAFCSQAQLQLSQDTLDASNKMSSGWDTPLANKKSYQVTTESLLTNKTGAISYETIIDAIISGATLTFWMGAVATAPGTTDKSAYTYTRDTTKPSFSGTLLPTECTIKSDYGSIASCSGTFKGVGALTHTQAVAAGA